MIRATKHLGLESCTLRVAAIVLEHLIGCGAEGAAMLADHVEHTLGPDARENLVPALMLLFAIGRLEYIDEIDAFQLARSKVAA